MNEQTSVAKVTDNAASGGVLAKLIIFSLSLGIVPIASYFTSLNYVWKGNSTYAAITAVVAANIVLVAYIVTSLLEDQNTKVPGETKKEK